MTSFLGAVANYFWPSPDAKKSEEEKGVLHMQDDGDAVIVDLKNGDEKVEQVADSVFPTQLGAPSVVGIKKTQRKVTYQDLFGVGKNTLKKNDKPQHYQVKKK